MSKRKTNYICLKLYLWPGYCYYKKSWLPSTLHSCMYAYPLEMLWEPTACSNGYEKTNLKTKNKSI